MSRYESILSNYLQCNIVSILNKTRELETDQPSMCSSISMYLIPFLPLITRGALIVRFLPIQAKILSEDEQDREGYRTHILAFAGFSFTALSAFAIVDTTLKTGLSWAIFYLLVSFFAFMFSLNWVAYKGARWEDHLATALSDVGTLSLFLAVIATLIATHSGSTPLIAGIATFVWVIDHGYRIYIDWKYQSKLLKD